MNESKPNETGTVAPDQANVVSFLSDPRSYGPGSECVDRIDTHGAHVFLAGEHAIKIKRAVKYAYMDFSTVERRHHAIERELEVNRVAAPEIYLDVVAITRAPDCSLRFGVNGTPVEWALRMRRFDQSQLLSRQVADNGLDGALAKELADAVFESHRRAPIATGNGNRHRYETIVETVVEAIDETIGTIGETAEFRLHAAAQIDRIGETLSRRESAGYLRRCHGDLHLNNIVLWRGRPLLFDAIEFDENLATIDTLYDLAFLLMDLDNHGERGAANILLNRYLWRSGSTLDLDGLATLPLFFALRAGVRAMVSLQRSRLGSDNDRLRLQHEAADYFSMANGYLRPAAPRLVAVGGYSGTGKSTLAGTLAPQIAPVPGAVHLRSDLERKTLFGAGETERLPASAYTPDASAQVYETLLDKSAHAVGAGHAVVVDAVFSTEDERAAIANVASKCGVAFTGLWLSAEAKTLVYRVVERRGDASDATADVVRSQIDRGVGRIDWKIIDASGSKGQTHAQARRALEI